jgi:hypothetical protein
MARRKTDQTGGGERPLTADFSAKMLETYAGMILDLADRSAAEGEAGPGWLSRSQMLDLTLNQDDRIVMLGLPELSDLLKGRLDSLADGGETIRLTVEELAGLFLALSQGISQANGQEALKVMQVAATVASRFTEHMSRQGPVRRRKGATVQAQPSQGRKTVYQFKITLLGVEPLIWRRVLTPDCSLTTLHRIIQVAMGWEDEHLYDFEIKGTRYGDPGARDGLNREDASRTKLGQIIRRKGTKLRYTYDFGDEWRHEIVVEQIGTPEAGRTSPVCLGGERACPPEDVGGPWGYMEFAEAIRDREHEQHERFLEWAGPFDPKAFDPDAVNEKLRRLR